MAGWRKPTEDDHGQELLVRSPDLVDDDVTPDGVCIGTIVCVSDGFEATCACWCLYHDEYLSYSISAPFSAPFEVHELPISQEVSS